MPDKKVPASTNPSKSNAMVEHSVLFSGPLPPPAVLEQYKAIDPSLPQRLMALVEKEQDARIAWNENEAKCKKLDLQNIRFGQIAGTVLVLILASCGLVALFLHAFTVAGVIFGTTILSLFSARIFTSSKK